MNRKNFRFEFVFLDEKEEIALRKSREIGRTHGRIATFDPALFSPAHWMLFLDSAVVEIARVQRVRRYRIPSNSPLPSSSRTHLTPGGTINEN